MDIQVILTDNDPKLGKRGDVVKVSSGYAQNFLFPNQKAKPATPANLKILNEEKARHDKHEAEILAQAKDLGAKLSALKLKMDMTAGDGDKLYGAVTNQDIANALAAHKLPIDRKKIHLHDPIKKLGSYKVEIKLHPDVMAHLHIEIVKKA